MARNYRKGAYQGAHGEQKEAKRIPVMTVTIVALTLVAAILLTVFLVNFFGRPRLSTSNGGATITDSRNGITYKLAPECYSADLDKSDPYAKLGDTEYYKLIYSDENGKAVTYDPLKMIGTEDEFGAISLYVAEGVTLPSLSEFETDKALVYYIRLIEYLSCAVNPVDAADIQKTMVNGEGVLRPLRTVEDSIRMVYLGSSAHPYITYVLKYYEDYSDGRYLYDSATDKCVKLSEGVLEGIFDR